MSEVEIDLNNFIDKGSRDKVFPILRKLDEIWVHNSKLTFCEIVKLLTENKDLTDKEFNIVLSDYIQNNKIKWNG